MGTLVVRHTFKAFDLKGVPPVMALGACKEYAHDNNSGKSSVY